jgi:predicted alpha/beta-hydrolase family hydrolase
MIADEVGAAGLVCLGYPFHPPGILATFVSSTSRIFVFPLIVQGRGTRSAGSTRSRIIICQKVRIVWIEAGDHSLKPPACSGRTVE